MQVEGRNSFRDFVEVFFSLYASININELRVFDFTKFKIHMRKGSINTHLLLNFYFIEQIVMTLPLRNEMFKNVLFIVLYDLSLPAVLLSEVIFISKNYNPFSTSSSACGQVITLM